MTDELADLEGQTPVEHALAGGEPQRVGWFRFYFADERWEWSPQVERMHGYEPGTVHPTTDLVLSHKHPDDYGQVAATLDEIRRTAGAFSTRHRIIDTRGERPPRRGGRRPALRRRRRGDRHHGFYVDVTPSMKQATTRSSPRRWPRSPRPQWHRTGQGHAHAHLPDQLPTPRSSCSNGARRRPTPSCGRSPSKLPRTSWRFPTTRMLPAGRVYDRLLLTAHLRVES